MSDYFRRHRGTEEGFVLQRFIACISKQDRIDVRIKWDKYLHSDNSLNEALEDYNKKELGIYQSNVGNLINRLKILEELRQSKPDWEKIIELETMEGEYSL